MYQCCISCITQQQEFDSLCRHLYPKGLPNGARGIENCPSKWYFTLLEGIERGCSRKLYDRTWYGDVVIVASLQ